MLNQTFGEMIFAPETESVSEFPSPESLKNRVIVSTKPPKENLESKSSIEVQNRSQKEKDSTEEKEWGEELPAIRSELPSSKKVIH